MPKSAAQSSYSSPGDGEIQGTGWMEGSTKPYLYATVSAVLQSSTKTLIFIFTQSFHEHVMTHGIMKSLLGVQ